MVSGVPESPVSGKVPVGTPDAGVAPWVEDPGEHAHAVLPSPVVDADELIAEYDAERPSRRLSGPLAHALSVAAAALSVYVLYRVFVPDNPWRTRMLFLAVVLPMTFLVYRPGLFRPRG